jgi:tol-pal system protein YbgF
MKIRTTALSCALLAFSSTSILAQTNLPVPVVDRAPTVTSGNPNVAAPRSAQPSPNAEMYMMVEQLAEEVRYLRGQLEEMGHQLKKMRTNQRDRYRDLDRRITSINRQMTEQPAVSAPPSTVIAPPLASNPSTAADADLPVTADAKPPGNDQPVAVAPVPSVSDRQAYKDAFALVRKRSFNDALNAFGSFIKVYPNSTLVPNVLYWTGEVHRAKPEPDQDRAKDAYQRLVELFPNHQKAADAYYKLGLTYSAMGDSAQAKAMMKKVVELYPNQSSAKLANDYLTKNR